VVLNFRTVFHLMCAVNISSKFSLSLFLPPPPPTLAGGQPGSSCSACTLKRPSRDNRLKTANFVMEISGIRKPLIDDRQYGSLTLPNGIVAVLVSDPSTLVAAVAMSVACGQMNDPSQVQGLAHFTEHMVFLGSGRPGCAGESSFTDFLATAKGDHNAYRPPPLTTIPLFVLNASLAQVHQPQHHHVPLLVG
jgi:hypothetical protein